MATPREPELYKDKIEVSLDGRQIFYLFFGGAVIVGLVFVLGVLIGRRVEARGHVDRADTQAERDPLAALDRLERSDDLSFRQALTGTAAPTDVEKTIGEIERRRGEGKPEAVKAEAAKTEARQPEAKHGVKVEGKAEVKPPGKPEAKPDAKPEGKAEVKTETRSEAKAETKSEAKAARSEPKAEARSETKPDGKAEAKPDAKSENRSDAKAEARNDAKAEARAEGKAEPRNDAKSENRSDAKAEPRSEAKAEARNDAKADAKADGKGRFTLQLSSFQDRAEAEAFLGATRSAGFQPYLIEADVTGRGTWYRVRLGSYRSLEAANDAKAEYEKSAKKSAQVMRL